MNSVTKWNFKKNNVETIADVLLARTKLFNALRIMVYVVFGLGIFDLILFYINYMIQKAYDPSYPSFLADKDVHDLIFTTAFCIILSGLLLIWIRYKYSVKRRSIFTVNCDPAKYIAVIDAMLAKKPSLYKSLYLKEDGTLYVTALNHIKDYNQVYARLDELAVKNKSVLSMAQNAFLRGVTLASEGRLDESRSCLQYFEKCLYSGKIRRANYQRFCILRDDLEAAIAFHSNDFAKAAEFYRSALKTTTVKISPMDEVILRYGLAKSEYALGNYMDAYISLARAHEIICDTPHPMAVEINNMYAEMNTKLNTVFA